MVGWGGLDVNFTTLIYIFYYYYSTKGNKIGANYPQPSTMWKGESMRSELCGLDPDAGQINELVHVAVYRIGEELREFHFWASSLEEAKDIALEKLIGYLGKRAEIVRVYCRSSCKLCGECKRFKSDGHGLKYEGVCNKDGHKTSNLTWCKFGDYITSGRKFNGGKCKQCGYWLMGRENEFCSASCKRDYTKETNTQRTYDRTCAVCGKKFTALSPKSKYCGKECKLKIGREKEKARRKKSVGIMI